MDLGTNPEYSEDFGLDSKGLRWLGPRVAFLDLREVHHTWIAEQAKTLPHRRKKCELRTRERNVAPKADRPESSSDQDGAPADPPTTKQVARVVAA